jgi:hypothetical protein
MDVPEGTVMKPPMVLLIPLQRLFKFDDLIKSQKSRHSCESKSPELLELTGFPLSRE